VYRKKNASRKDIKQEAELLQLYFQIRGYDRVIEIWERCQESLLGDLSTLLHVADSYRKSKVFQKSKQLYEKVLGIEGGNPYALNGLGHLHFDLQFYREAMDYWQKMLANDPQNIKAITAIGNCYRKLKQFERGLDWYEKARKLEADNFYALFGIADCYRGLKMYRKSLEAWEAILAFEPDNKIIITRAADAYRNLGELTSAETYYRRALELDFDIYAVLGLAAVYRTEGKYRQSIMALEEILRRYPTNQRAVLEIADNYVGLGEVNRAIDTLQDFVKAAGDNEIISEKLRSLLKSDPM